jgi:asparaginyl-tRNA synthetase
MKFISIQDAINKGKGKVSIRGWVYRERGSKEFRFIILRDSTNIIQCIFKKENFSKKWNKLNSILIEASMEITGTIKKDKRAPTGYEIQVSDYKLIGPAIDFPIYPGEGFESLLDKRHLWLRSRYMTSILKIRSTVFKAIHEYFREKGFYEYHSPVFQTTQCEGGSTLFEVPYFGKKTFLAQTWQLYAEPAIFSLEKIYTIAPSFRAEKSKTARHLTEYWHAEMEAAWCDFKELQDYGEDLIKYVVKKVLKENKQELALLKRDIKPLQTAVKKKFLRITYTQALKILKQKCKMNIPWGKDLRTIEEDKLSKLHDTGIIITEYPKGVKAFYMRENPKDSKTVLGYDLIAPEGYGEIIGASEREPDEKKLIKRLKELKENPKEYKFYLDTRKYGSIPHAGFGLGVERLLAWICGLTNIKDAIAFPRTPDRFTP